MPSAARVIRVRIGLRTAGDPLDSPTPTLRWIVESDTPGWRQSSAVVELETDGDRVEYHHASDESVAVEWPFGPLAPRQRGRIRVRVTGNDGAVSEWSEPTEFRTGFLGDGEWIARFLGLRDPQRRGHPGMIRTEFDLDRPVAEAVLSATALGVYRAEVNGSEAGDEVLAPGWTPYRSRLVHSSLDVTGLLHPGRNAIGLSFGGGWYTEQFGFGLDTSYGTQPSAAVQLVVVFEDGSTRTIATGADWRALADGPVVESGIYDGEHYDARRVPIGWSSAGFDDAAWEQPAVVEVDVVPGTTTLPTTRRTQELAVREVLTSPSGATILDFGQNLVGRVRIRVTGPAGTVITLRHAEVLENGELGIRPLRSAKATDSYTLAGTGEEIWGPSFTFHGFRYAEVSGWPGALDPAAVTAQVLHTDMERTGWFDSSHPLLNQLHENVVWGMRGNFLHLPTDCPQRDERLGWTGDIEVFGPTASFLYDAEGFLTSWLRDLAIEQIEAEGSVPWVIPNALGDTGSTPAAAWGDAATVVPWTLHERFGGTRVLRDQLGSMADWVACVRGVSERGVLWADRFQFGDWLDPTAPPEQADQAKTDPDIVATAYLYRSAQLLGRAARVLGEHVVAAEAEGIAEEVRLAWLDEYVTPAGRTMSDAQTAYALAIVFDLVRDADQRRHMGDRLAWLVRRNRFRIGTGFVGTPIIADALTLTGHSEVAGKLLLQTECPSWLYAVTMGATTIWERWDSLLPDGSINPGGMTSFNHYALGAVADWMHRTVAGLAPGAPGYRELLVAPVPIAGLTHASARLASPYGLAEAGWAEVDGGLRVSVRVPANATALVRLPGRPDERVGSGAHEWLIDDPRDAALRVSLGSAIRDLREEPEILDALTAALAELDATAAGAMARHRRRFVRWIDQYPAQTLDEAFASQLPEAESRLRAVFAEHAA
jgi:alpha-L-rhamnosidase